MTRLRIDHGADRLARGFQSIHERRHARRRIANLELPQRSRHRIVYGLAGGADGLFDVSRQPIEDRFLSRAGARLRGERRLRCGEPVVAVVRSGRGREAAAHLRALEAEAEARDVVVGIAEHRIEFAGVHAHRPVLLGPHAADVNLLGRPRRQSVAKLFRIPNKISSRDGGLLCHQARSLVIAVAVAIGALESRQDDRRPLHADDADHVAKYRFPSPLADRFFERLGETVIDKGRKVLLVDSVVLAGDEEFFSPDQPERVEQLRPDGVVTRLAAVERQQRHARAVVAAQLRQHAAMLVIGMRGDVHHAHGGPELLHLRPRLGGAILSRHGLPTRDD